MTGPGDVPPGLARRTERRPPDDDAAILGFDLAGGARHPDDPAQKLERLLAQAGKRYEAEEFQTAIGFADQALALDPGCTGAWLWKAHSLVRLGNLDRAIAELTRARKAVHGADAAHKIDDLLGWCRRHLTDRPLEEARRALRAGNPRQAVAILLKLTDTLTGDETFADRLTYARERVLAAESRTPPPGSALTLPALQKVLAWLCREELTHGDRALAAEDYRAAAGCFVDAGKHDERNTAAALGEATALYALARDSHHQQAQTWAEARKTVTLVAGLLQRADLQAQTAAADRTLADAAGTVRKAVAELTKTNDARGKRADKILTVHKCVDDYNAMMRQFNRGANGLGASNLLTSFPAIEVQAHRLFQKYGPDDPDIGPSLVSLHDAVTQLRRNIRW